VTAAKSFIDSERLWSAALEKAERERSRSATGAEDASAGAVVLIDSRAGAALPERLVTALGQGGLAVRQLDSQVSEEALRDAATLVVHDTGAPAERPAYDETEIARITKFVAAGGGLVYFGPRAGPPAGGSAYDALLRGRFGIGLRPGNLTLAPDAPRDYPKQHVDAQAVRRHALTAGLGAVRFPRDVPVLEAPPSAVLMVTPPFVHSGRRPGPLPLVAARAFRRGRVVVVASVPSLTDQAAGPSALRFCLNAVRWTVAR
jgi:hypothetical protein